MTKENRVNGYKVLSLGLALILVLGGAVGGTFAWLSSTPDPVVNTFTYGDINITLEETDTMIDGDGNPNTNKYKMIPGQTVTKDPVVTVKSGSEEMWLFVKLNRSPNFDAFMDYQVNSGWVVLPGTEGVYYRHITAEEVAEEDLLFHVLANDTVVVKETVTKEMLNGLDADPANITYPTLTVTAYAVQYAGSDTAEDAWVKVNTSTP